MKKTTVIILILLITSISYAGSLYKTKSGYFASISEEYFNQAVSLVTDDDQEAFQQMVAAKKVFMLKANLSVYLVKYKWLGITRFRLYRDYNPISLVKRGHL